MELSIRLVSRGVWSDPWTDAVSCTYNLDGFTPMSVVIRRLGFDRSYFDQGTKLKGHHQPGFKVLVHRTNQRCLITSSKTACWDDAPQATTEIIKTVVTEKCKSLCMTHFGFIPGNFPKAAFHNCLQMAVSAKEQDRLDRLVVDVDERHSDIATELFNLVQAQQSYRRRHNLPPSRYVELSEAGSSENQTWLSAELLVHSGQADRCVEALKWLVIANQIRESSVPREIWLQHKEAVNFLASAMSIEQVDAAFASAGEWLAKKIDGVDENLRMVPEFLCYQGACEAETTA